MMKRAREKDGSIISGGAGPREMAAALRGLGGCARDLRIKRAKVVDEVEGAGVD